MSDSQLRVLKLSKNKLYKIEGMTCASCSQIIESNSKKIPGINSIAVNFATEKADVNFNENFDEQAFFQLLSSLGYRGADANGVELNEDNEFFNQTFYHSLICLMTGTFLMTISMGPLSTWLPHSISNFIQLFASVAILLFFGKPYLKSTIHFFNTFEAGMNTLIGLGIISSFVYSFALMLLSSHSHVYFESIPYILGFTLLGHFLEEKAKTKARSSLSSLYKMQIKFASKIVDSAEERVPVIELKVGDVIRLRPGDKIPLDGEIIEGTTHTDESMISGESLPNVKKVGDKVFAGSLNLEGSVIVKITSELHQTFISDVVAYVEKAQLKKANIQKIADKVVSVFVPFILFFSIITFLAWIFFYKNHPDTFFQAVSHMIAVLLIACPCALGLAVPMAVMLSTSNASKSGLLISGGDVIEKANDIGIVVFDKTGTLTKGKPSVISFATNITEDEFLKISASCTQYSNHPLSNAITEFVKTRNLSFSDPDKFKNIAGHGFEAQIYNKRILIGSADLMRENQIHYPPSEKIGSHVYVAIDNIFSGVFNIYDSIKPHARDLVTNLNSIGVEVVMLTGDNELIANSIANELRISKVYSNVKPVEKAQIIEELKRTGIKVAMVGDGINDAPALTAANLSLAMSSGSDIAVEASDVSVLEGKIEKVYDFFVISKKTMTIIKQNLFLSFIYNLLCIPLAAGVFFPWWKVTLTPMWASLAMGLSSVSVILSSLRLKK